MNRTIGEFSSALFVLAGLAVCRPVYSATIMVPEDHLIHEAVKLAATGDTARNTPSHTDTDGRFPNSYTELRCGTGSC